MKTTIRILAILAILCASLAAQTASEAWNIRKNGPGNGRDFGRAVTTDAAGNFIIAGALSAPGGIDANNDFYLAKHDANGVLLWERSKTGPNTNFDEATSVITDSAGNVIATGTLFTNNFNDYYTVKYSSNGVFQWEAHYNGPANKNDAPTGIAVDAAGNVVVTGTSANADDTSAIYTVKYAAGNGAVIWDKRVSAPDNNYGSNAVAVDAAGDVVIAGGNGNLVGGGFYVAKYAGATGNLIWETVPGESIGGRDPFAMALDAAGNIVVTGYTHLGFYGMYTAKLAAADGTLIWDVARLEEESLSGYVSAGFDVKVDSAGHVVVTGQLRQAAGGANFFTGKYDGEFGAPLWEKIYNGPGNGDDTAFALGIDAADNVVVTGVSQEDYYTRKYGAVNGAVIWEARYNSPTNVLDEPAELVLTPDGGAVVTGTSWDPNSFTEGDIVTIRYTPPPPDTVTAPPTLVAPAENGKTKSPITVTYELPEEAQPGSVQIRFHNAGASINVELTVDTAGETVGPHTYTIHAADPGASDGIITATGGPMVDGSYSVIVSYQDVFNNPRTSDFHLNVTVDNVTQAPDLNLPGPGMTVGNPITVDFFLPEAAQPGSVTLSFGATALTLAPSEETQGGHSFAFDPANPTASAEVLSGAAIADGTYTVTLSYKDALGNGSAADASANVVVDTALPPPVDPVFTAHFMKGGAVPKAGTDSRVQAGATWTGFGVPAVTRSGHVVVIGKWKAPAAPPLPAQSGVGIFLQDGLLVKVGEPVPGIAGTTFKAFKDPAANGFGNVAFIATIAGPGVLSTNDTVVVGRPLGDFQVLAREGAPAPGTDGATFKAFTSVSVRENTPGTPGTLFTATLLQGSGAPAATTANDTGAWWWPAADDSLGLLVREGDTTLIPGETVKNFMVLKALAGSPGHGRGLISSDQALFQVGLTSGKQAVIRAEYDLRTVHAITGGTLGGTALPDATWLKLGLPSANEGGMNAAVLATLKAGVGGVTPANAKGIFETADEGATWEPLARMGDVAPGFGGVATFSAFKDPVNSDELTDVAFIGTAKGAGVLSTDNDGIWFRPHHGGLTLVAREGAQPPGAPAGAKWKSFSSVAMPGNLSGPIFTAMLHKGIGATPGPGGITSLDDFALYAADGAGGLREILRENQPLLGQTVKTFNVLKAVGGSAGATRAFNVDEVVVAQVTFTDGTTAVVRIQLPPPVIVN